MSYLDPDKKQSNGKCRVEDHLPVGYVSKVDILVRLVKYTTQ